MIANFRFRTLESVSVKLNDLALVVIPAKAGIHKLSDSQHMDSRLRGNDDPEIVGFDLGAIAARSDDFCPCVEIFGATFKRDLDHRDDGISERKPQHAEQRAKEELGTQYQRRRKIDRPFRDHRHD